MNLKMAANLVMCKSHPHSTVCQGMKDARQKGSWSKAEAGHCVVEAEFLKREQERPLVKVQSRLQWRPQDVGDVRTLGHPLRAA